MNRIVLFTCVLWSLLNLPGVTSSEVCNDESFNDLILEERTTKCSQQPNNLDTAVDRMDAEDYVMLGLSTASSFYPPLSLAYASITILNDISGRGAESMESALEQLFSDVVDCIENAIDNYRAEDYLDDYTASSNLFERGLNQYIEGAVNDVIHDAFNQINSLITAHFVTIEEPNDYLEAQTLLDVFDYASRLYYLAGSTHLSLIKERYLDDEEPQYIYDSERANFIQGIKMLYSWINNSIDIMTLMFKPEIVDCDLYDSINYPVLYMPDISYENRGASTRCDLYKADSCDLDMSFPGGPVYDPNGCCKDFSGIKEMFLVGYNDYIAFINDRYLPFIQDVSNNIETLLFKEATKVVGSINSTTHNSGDILYSTEFKSENPAVFITEVCMNYKPGKGHYAITKVGFSDGSIITESKDELYQGENKCIYSSQGCDFIGVAVNDKMDPNDQDSFVFQFLFFANLAQSGTGDSIVTGDNIEYVQIYDHDVTVILSAIYTVYDSNNDFVLIAFDLTE